MLEKWGFQTVVKTVENVVCKNLLHTFLKQWQLTEQIPSQLLEELEDVLTLVEDYQFATGFQQVCRIEGAKISDYLL
jgi:predicted house-cleaning noncanonical NTP pyrophosphatase (MazG superfamily)